MEERDLIYIKNVAEKYNTYLYPELRYHVETYLMHNLDKAKYYAHYNLNINTLIQNILKDKEILNGIKELNTKTIMDIISPFVEKKVFIREI